MKILRYTLSMAIAMAVSVNALAEAPKGYYNSLAGKREGELKTAVYNLTHNFTKVSSYQALPQYFFRTDVYPNSNRWWDMYSDIPLYGPSFSGLNREHSFPKSWWGGSQTVGAYVDLNHLYPSEMRANTAKSNYPLGVVDRSQSIKFQNGITTVGYPVAGQGGGAQYVFEPADEYKGDFARTYFYMATTYQDLTWKYTFMVNNNLYPTLNTWSVNLLLKWHRQDPVSQKERDRNDVVYTIQNNRNPFIDQEELAEYIWGNKKGQGFVVDDEGGTTGTPNLITPVQDMALDFGEVAVGKSVTSELFFRGENLSAPLTVRVYRDNGTGYFTLPGSVATVSIPANYANKADGYWLPVTYSPTAVGEHTARILISGGGVSGSRGIELRGNCLPVPELGACTATSATIVDKDTYVANWTTPASDVVDYWIITRTMYKGGSATSEEVLAEGPDQTITGFAENDYETYSVQSSRLGFRSPMSNVVEVRHDAGVDDIAADKALAVYTYEGGIRFICATNHSNARVMDTLGRTVAQMDVVENGTCIDLPTGIYMVVTDQSHRPIKVIVR